MRGFWFIECDIDGSGKCWRLVRVEETASATGSYFYATFVDGSDFQEHFNVFLDNGSRMVGPLTVNNMLACVSAGEYILDVDMFFLPQKAPGEARMLASKSNGLQKAAEQVVSTSPDWKRLNFDGGKKCNAH